MGAGGTGTCGVIVPRPRPDCSGAELYGVAHPAFTRFIDPLVLPVLSRQGAHTASNSREWAWGAGFAQLIYSSGVSAPRVASRVSAPRLRDPDSVDTMSIITSANKNDIASFREVSWQGLLFVWRRNSSSTRKLF